VSDIIVSAGLPVAYTEIVGVDGLDSSPVVDQIQYALLKQANGTVLSCRHHYDENTPRRFHEVPDRGQGARP
jgi:hypothetical protein